jgi:hypothetical protein
MYTANTSEVNMNKSLLTIGIVLSLGTVGCAGFGVQQASSLTAQLHGERGVDSLWSATEPGPSQGLETPRYADQALGDLWTSAESADSARELETKQNRGVGDLWNPSSVTRSWEISNDAPSTTRTFGGSSPAGVWY